MSQKVHPKGFRLRSTGHLNGAATLPDRIPLISNSLTKLVDRPATLANSPSGDRGVTPPNSPNKPIKGA